MNTISKRTTLIVLLCVAACGALVSLVWSNRQSFGHNVNSPEARSRPTVSQAKGMAERFQRELGLSESEHAPIQAIMVETEQKMQSIRNDAKLTGDQKRDRMNTLLRAASKQIKSHLTPEQAARYDEVVRSAHH